jgi:hypothetical protein
MCENFTIILTDNCEQLSMAEIYLKIHSSILIHNFAFKQRTSLLPVFVLLDLFSFSFLFLFPYLYSAHFQVPFSEWVTQDVLAPSISLFCPLKGKIVSLRYTQLQF